MAKFDKILELFNQYLGYTPSSQEASKLSMSPDDEVESILSNTKSDVQKTAIENAHTAIGSLAGKMPAGSPAQEYLTTIAKGKSELEQQYGLTEAEEKMGEAGQFYQDIAQKGPMFDQVMKSGMEGVSPNFLGATRRDLETYFKGIPNPFVRDSMINTYLNSADKGMTSTLNALNGLYQTALIGAESAMKGEQNHYNKIVNTVQDLYGELQWVARNRYAEQSAIKETAENWTDFEIRATITELKAGQLEINPDATPEEMYAEAIQQIESNDSLLNKAYAKDLAATIYGVTSISAKAKAEADARAAALKAGQPKSYPYIDPTSGKMIKSDIEKKAIEKENKENLEKGLFGQTLLYGSGKKEYGGTSPLTITGGDTISDAFWTSAFGL